MLHRGERTPRRHQTLPVRPAVQVVGLRLVQPGGVAERENDGPVDVARHFADGLLREGARARGRADEDLGFHAGDDGAEGGCVEIFLVGKLGGGPGEGLLRDAEVGLGGDEQALLVDAPGGSNTHISK